MTRSSYGSWCRTDATHPFAGQDIGALLAARARQRADHPFLVWQPFDGPAETWTFAQFDHRVASLASGLAQAGLRPGERVLVHLENSPEFLFTWFACARLGAVAVTTSTRSTADELGYYATDSEVVAAVTQPGFAAVVGACSPALRWMAVAGDDGLLPRRDAPGHTSFAGLHGDPNDVPALLADPWRPLSVQYTSGTTARPKGVLWTHGNGLWAGRTSATHEALRAEDVHMTYAPLFHTNAMAYSVLASLWAGCTIVLVPRWSTSRFWDISRRHRCTWMSMVGYADVIRQVERPDLHFYRQWGGAACDQPTDADFGLRTIGWWGMTETVSHGIVGNTSVPDRPLSIGRPAPEYLVAVVDGDGQAVEPEQTGNLLLRGTQGLSLFAEYLNQPVATAAAFDDQGWFVTGDQVTPRDDGWIDFAGRAKDMLKVGGENVAAAEIERVAEGVDGITAAAAVARADSVLGEVPVLFLSGNGDTETVREEVLRRCRRDLADFKVPREIHLLEALPTVTIGKIDKGELRAALREERPPIVRPNPELSER